MNAEYAKQFGVEPLGMSCLNQQYQLHRATSLVPRAWTRIDVPFMPQQIIWIVDGPVTIGSWATVSGTIVGNSKVNIGFGSIIDGAVIANNGVTTGSWVVMQHKGFIGW